MASMEGFAAVFYSEPLVLGLFANVISAFLVCLQNFSFAHTNIRPEGVENILAGGFGMAKNPSTLETVQFFPCAAQVVRTFHASKKLIGLCCITQVLAARVFPGCELMVGHDKECEKWPYAKTADAMKELGCKHMNKHVGEIHVDVKNRLVTTSAFMCNAPSTRSLMVLER